MICQKLDRVSSVQFSYSVRALISIRVYNTGNIFIHTNASVGPVSF